MKFLLEKHKKTIISLLLVLMLLFLTYIIMNYFLALILPFLIAVIISCVNEPVISYLESKLRLRRSIASFISLVLTVSAIIAFISLCVFKVYYELVKLNANLPYYMESFSATASACYNRVSVFYYYLPESLSDVFESNLKALLPKLEIITGRIAESIINSIASIPKVAVFITVTLLSSYFISRDRKKIGNFIYKQLPVNLKQDFIGIKSDTFSTIAGYIKAQLILMCITFIETTLGLIAIKSEYAVLIGFIAAMADILPIVGTGIVLFPLIAWNIIAGNIQMALGITAVYLLGVILRQIIEPKIVSSQTGIHPFATLVSMYLGMMLFGFPGLFIGPIFVTILKSLHKSGLISVGSD
ncbi:MAG TPA: sporulation integral membrane protein YtvI [Acetivibrio sp.]|uniref:sporulation integral membrane protein YtvI n=1 Tax=Acetivibrio sp. TaxID=1872092 RepID=UPI002C54A4AC|nr:sporulation integral membrane protein YtvI [Acetivibrio sp.]HOM03189.1 sporulation integral membrane protein YtvI [Acetivibrio sp.]